MEKIIIIGAGGFGREVKMLIDDINKCNLSYDFIGYYDDGIGVGTIVNGFPVLGNLKDLLDLENGINVALGIANPKTKSEIISRIKKEDFFFPVLIHPSVIIGNDDVVIGQGTLICAASIITCNIHIMDFVTINLMCTIGHDTIIKDFVSFMPSVNISGEVVIHEKVYVGTGAKVINQLEIGQSTIVGAGAIVSKSLPEFCTAIGIPAKPIKFHHL
jgi:sugar O-acyltransferase (sialic acid O-acetyltransferase NeuD family)